MKTLDDKKVIFYCKCGRLKVWDDWVFPTKKAKKQIQKKRQMRFLKFIKSVCDECLAAKK